MLKIITGSSTFAIKPARCGSDSRRRMFCFTQSMPMRKTAKNSSIWWITISRIKLAPQAKPRPAVRLDAAILFR